MQRFEDEKEEGSFSARTDNLTRHQSVGQSVQEELKQIPGLREIRLDGEYGNMQPAPKRYPNNSISNQKYSIFNFVPVVLFNQFKYFFNLFFLLVALSQFVEPLRVGFLFTFMAPLVFVLVLTMVKEGYDDIQRHNRDKMINLKTYKKLESHTGRVLDIQSSQIKVGDIIQVNQNERVPADMVLLYTTDRSGTVFIRTDQLDGETDWKVRRPISFTNQEQAEHEDLIKINGWVKCEGPSKQIYDFKGIFTAMHGSRSKAQEIREPLTQENTLWSDTVLASSGYVLGIVVYTGRQTRAQMNAKTPVSKMCLLDLEINKLSKILFVQMLLLSGIIVVMNGFHGDWAMFYFRVVLLLSSIIPISLRVNLDLAKMWYSYGINTDNQIPNTVARNSTIPEELGRIQFLITDKTGTLTQNDMITKKLATEFAVFQVDEDHDDLKKLVIKQCESSDGPASDYDPVTGKIKSKKRDRQAIVRDFATALTICNNVTPVSEEAMSHPGSLRHSNSQSSSQFGSRPLLNVPPQTQMVGRQSDAGSNFSASPENELKQVVQDNSIPNLQASSPDEVALVKYAWSLDMHLIERDRTYVVIKNAAGVIEHYDIVLNFPFSSSSKKMSCLLKHQETGRHIYYVKGAESVMGQKIKNNAKHLMDESCELLANDGLRTLVFAQKFINEQELEDLMHKYEQASARINNRDMMIQQVLADFEKDLDYLGVTGVEDKLQNNVQITIGALKYAGIQVWMLTGDKIETATTIAISAGFKERRQQIFYIRDIDESEILEIRLNDLERQVHNSIIVIDGISLDTAFHNDIAEQRFFSLAIQAPTVCVCRCSPTQKADIAKLIRKYTKGKRIAAVGDGGNDVGMILEADVGIGIVGKEGMQASLASDFSITEFGFLRRLILWHGRLSYKRSSVLSQFVIHRGMIISVIQGIFIILFYFAAIPIYNGFLMLGYSTIYTSLPVFMIVFDEDVRAEDVIRFPPLYRSLQKGREMNGKTFSIWVWKSIFQGSLIILFSIVFFDNSFTNIVTITFSSLIMIELLNVYTAINNFKSIMWLIQLCTAICYFLSILFMREYFDISIIDQIFFVKIAAITLITWAPLHFLSYMIDIVDPSEQKKVMDNA